MAKIDITKTELVWPGKYDDDGRLHEPPRVSLPFQVIETINESRATREAAAKPQQVSLFDVWNADEGETFEDGWTNKLIWGDNLPIMSSLLARFAGKIDLIYIDPPFATGADFNFTTRIGDEQLEVEKQQSTIEEKAYRDTWGRGLDSYMSMLTERLRLMADLLAPRGSIYVHLGPNISHYVKPVLDDVFGIDNYRNEIVWQRFNFHADAKRYGVVHDVLLFYSKTKDMEWHPQRKPFEQSYIDSHFTQQDTDGRKYQLDNPVAKGQGPVRRFGDKLLEPPAGTHWRFGQERIDAMMRTGQLIFTSSGRPRVKRYLDDIEGAVIHSLWNDISPLNSQADERLDYETQKPEKLLERVILSSSSESGLVADFFSGSGTTMAVAERLGRRWIGADLGRFAIHTARKRLLGIEGCRPFEVLNLGKYERQFWQTIAFNRDKDQQERTAFEYIAFILRLYAAEPFPGFQFVHGKRADALVHVGAIDSPVTIEEVNSAIDECISLRSAELHVLGWEWEMGLNDLMRESAKQRGISLRLLEIPDEVMEQQAVDRGDIRFFELAYLNADPRLSPGLTLSIELTNFAIPNTDLIPEDVREKITKWSDYVDYWAVDWDFQNDTFMNGWVTYRTRRDRHLALTSDPHTYDRPGFYNVMVKVIDVFGNDTSKVYIVDVTE